jgi:hypothetical protein
VAWAVVSDRRATAELEAEREQLLQRVYAHSGTLKESQLRILVAVQRHLFRASGKYAGDFVGAELKALNLDSILARPSVYVRGALGAFDTPEGTKLAVSRSANDGFLFCLTDPVSPTASENELLQATYPPKHTDGAAQFAASHLRLQDAVVTLELLSESWVFRVKRARDVAQLHELRQLFEGAPIEAGIRAAQAEVLIYALDEPKEPETETSFDGGSNHAMRVGLVNLKTGQEVLRLRKRVDLDSVSELNRLRFGGGITSCKMGTEVRTYIATMAGAR